MALWDPLTRLLFGADFFISYARADATEYAKALDRALVGEGFSTALDRNFSLPGNETPRPVIRALRRSSALVLLGTQGAARSKNVPDEVTIFQALNRPIVFVLLNDPDPTAKWKHLDVGGAIAADASAGAPPGAPSTAVIDQIVVRGTFTRQRVRLFRIAVLVAIAIVLAALGILWFSVQAASANAEAELAESRKRQAEERAGDLDDKARALTENLQDKLRDLAKATIAQKEADVTRSIAEAQAQGLEAEVTTLQESERELLRQADEIERRFADAEGSLSYVQSLSEAVERSDTSPSQAFALVAQAARTRPGELSTLAVALRLAATDRAWFGLEFSHGQPIEDMALSPSRCCVATVSNFEGLLVKVLDLDARTLREFDLTKHRGSTWGWETEVDYEDADQLILHSDDAALRLNLGTSAVDSIPAPPESSPPTKTERRISLRREQSSATSTKGKVRREGKWILTDHVADTSRVVADLPGERPQSIELPDRRQLIVGDSSGTVRLYEVDAVQFPHAGKDVPTRWSGSALFSLVDGRVSREDLDGRPPSILPGEGITRLIVASPFGRLLYADASGALHVWNERDRSHRKYDDIDGSGEVWLRDNSSTALVLTEAETFHRLTNHAKTLPWFPKSTKLSPTEELVTANWTLSHDLATFAYDERRMTMVPGGTDIKLEAAFIGRTGHEPTRRLHLRAMSNPTAIGLSRSGRVVIMGVELGPTTETIIAYSASPGHSRFSRVNAERKLGLTRPRWVRPSSPDLSDETLASQFRFAFANDEGRDRGAMWDLWRDRVHRFDLPPGQEIAEALVNDQGNAALLRFSDQSLAVGNPQRGRWVRLPEVADELQGSSISHDGRFVLVDRRGSSILRTIEGDLVASWSSGTATFSADGQALRLEREDTVEYWPLDFDRVRHAIEQRLHDTVPRTLPTTFAEVESPFTPEPQ